MDRFFGGESEFSIEPSFLTLVLWLSSCLREE